MFQKRRRRIYLDHASATPLIKEVYDAMAPFWSDTFGNAGAIHQEGVAASVAIAQARGSLAQLLHVRPEGITYTGSGTESNNLAILGTLAYHKSKGVSYADMEVVTTAIEHPSIMETVKYAASLGVHVTYVNVDGEGLIVTEAFEQALSARTVLVTFAYANSEIGVVQHVGKLSRIVRAKEKEFGTRTFVHLDAAQAPLWLSCELDRLGVDILSLDAGKCGGPKGIGVLARRYGVEILPYYFGGAQEKGLRPGTENTPLIVGATHALALAQQGYEARSSAVASLRDYFIAELLAIDGVVLNGSVESRIANNVNISVPGIDSEFAVVTLDEKGIACSTKSACGGAKGDGSNVVRVLWGDEVRALSTLRFSLGEETTKVDIDRVVIEVRSHIEAVRSFQSTQTK